MLVSVSLPEPPDLNISMGSGVRRWGFSDGKMLGGKMEATHGA
jgi:hypothetical protein